MRSDHEETRTQRARRQDIVKAAITVLNQQGYAKCSVDLIAKAAGTTKSTVLYHFGSKEAIFEAVMGEAYEDGARYMVPYIAAASSMHDKLHAYIGSNLRYIASNREHISAIHQILVGAMPHMPGSYDHNDIPVARLSTLLAMGQKSGEFRSFDTNIMAIAIRQTIDNASFYMLNHPDLDVETYIKEMVAIFDHATSK